VRLRIGEGDPEALGNLFRALREQNAWGGWEKNDTAHGVPFPAFGTKGENKKGSEDGRIPPRPGRHVATIMQMVLGASKAVAPSR